VIIFLKVFDNDTIFGAVELNLQHKNMKVDNDRIASQQNKQVRQEWTFLANSSFKIEYDANVLI